MDRFLESARRRFQVPVTARVPRIQALRIHRAPVVDLPGPVNSKALRPSTPLRRDVVDITDEGRALAEELGVGRQVGPHAVPRSAGDLGRFGGPARADPGRVMKC